MEININLHLNERADGDGIPEGDDVDPQDYLLTPREIGDAIAQLFKALDAKLQVQDPHLELPYHNDDSEDIFEATIRSSHLEGSRLIIFGRFLDGGGQVVDQHT